MTRQRRNPTDQSPEPTDLFRSIRSKIAQRGKAIADDGVTVDLLPVVTETLEEVRETRQSSAPTARLPIGQVLRGRYVIESLLADGGTGTVFKALDRARSEHTGSQAEVAIKVLHRQGGDAGVLSKLRREFYCTQTLSHQSIVKVFELDQDAEFPFFTMELIDGETLTSVMEKFRPGPLPRAYARAVIRELGAGMAHAHARGVIHGDLKPQKIMVTNAGELRILDFGGFDESTAALTPAYASCDLLEGGEADPRDDLFALACVSYELLAGEHPFQNLRSTEARALGLTPRRPPGLSGRQWNALTMGLAWDRASRPQSVREWLAELNLGSDPLGPVPEKQNDQSFAPGKGHRARGHMASALIALVAVVLVGGITWAVLSRPKIPSVAVEAADPEAASTPSVESLIADADRDDPEPPAAPAASKPESKSRTAVAQGAARPIDRTEKISVASASYAIRASEKFAEIRVHRSIGSKGGTSFDWWTEPGSALAGTDFAPQAPTTIFFPSGVHAVSLFIKLMPNTSRKRAAVFYVVLGNPSTGSALGALSKAAVSLHP
ncbi:MAG TPA: protein kinase [Steroidobacteraceae bacterium]|jgi:serine/threonine protein kinase|nr:protein kinase [Steroidobacteraceae bacterium]